MTFWQPLFSSSIANSSSTVRDEFINKFTVTQIICQFITFYSAAGWEPGSRIQSCKLNCKLHDSTDCRTDPGSSMLYFTYKHNTKHLKEDRYVTLVQTFLFLGAAEAAGGLLELITVNFDHPKRAEHLCQVGGFVTEERSDLNTFSSPDLQKYNCFALLCSWVQKLTMQRGRSSTWWQLR